jgi:hypothetical protein
MNENKNDILKHTATYGAIVGFALIIYSVLLYILGLSLSRALGYLSFLIIIGGLYVGIKNFRDNEPSGTISYGRALGTGVLICVFLGIIGSLFTYIQFRFIDTGLVEQIIEMAEEKLYDKGIPEDMIEIQMSAMSKMFTPGLMAVFGFISYLFWGTVFSLILAAILKKEPHLSEGQQ